MVVAALARPGLLEALETPWAPMQDQELAASSGSCLSGQELTWCLVGATKSPCEPGLGRGWLTWRLEARQHRVQQAPLHKLQRAVADPEQVFAPNFRALWAKRTCHT